MTPSQLFALPVERVDKDLTHLFGYYYNHLPEAGDKDEIRNWIPNVKQGRAEIRFIKDFCFDGRRVWQLAVVCFDGKPAMITQNAGREGDDHARRFITDRDGVLALAGYINSLRPVEMIREDDNSRLIGLDQDYAFLDEFYDQKLCDPFRRWKGWGK